MSSQQGLHLLTGIATSRRARLPGKVSPAGAQPANLPSPALSDQGPPLQRLSPSRGQWEMSAEGGQGLSLCQDSDVTKECDREVPELRASWAGGPTNGFLPHSLTRTKTLLPAPATLGPAEQPHSLPFQMPTGHSGSPPPFAQLLGLPLELPLNPILLFQAISAASCWVYLPHAPRTRPLLTTLAWTTLLVCLLPSAPYALSHVAPTGVTPLPCLKPPTQGSRGPLGPHVAWTVSSRPSRGPHCPTVAPSTSQAWPFLRAVLSGCLQCLRALLPFTWAGVLASPLQRGPP